MPTLFHKMIGCFLAASFLGVTAHANLPSDAYTGYWAMTEPVLGSYVVVNFRKTGSSIISTQYQFSCNEDGSFLQTGAVPSTLSPSAGGLLVYEHGDSRPASELSVLGFIPNEGLILQQKFTERLSGLQSVFPEGMVFAYAYTPILRPLCDLEE
ncbi:MAG: hypothetical protein Q4B88_01995 [Moraxella sp.]|nr:hypothetical protein [Moraxella sp.]